MQPRRLCGLPARQAFAVQYRPEASGPVNAHGKCQGCRVKACSAASVEGMSTPGSSRKLPLHRLRQGLDGALALATMPSSPSQALSTWASTWAGTAGSGHDRFGQRLA